MLLTELDALAQAWKLAIDPAGRIIALTNPPRAADQLLRLDLSTGMSEVVTLPTSSAVDMDLVVIPEPSSFCLMLPGILLFSTLIGARFLQLKRA